MWAVVNTCYLSFCLDCKRRVAHSNPNKIYSSNWRKLSFLIVMNCLKNWELYMSWLWLYLNNNSSQFWCQLMSIQRNFFCCPNECSTLHWWAKQKNNYFNNKCQLLYKSINKSFCFVLSMRQAHSSNPNKILSWIVQ